METVVSGMGAAQLRMRVWCGWGAAMAATVLMTACGGGDSGPAGSSFVVDASLPGFMQASTRGGEPAAQLTVEAWTLDLARLEVNSSTATEWSVEPPDASVIAVTDSPTQRVFDLSRLEPSTLTLVFRQVSTTVEARVTLTVRADQTRHSPRARSVGETFTYNYTDEVDGVESSYEPRSRVVALDPLNWSYQTETPPVVGSPTGLIRFAWFAAGGNLYDENFRSGSGSSIVGVHYRREWRHYDFPLYEGKQWSTEFLWFADDEFFTATVYEVSRVAAKETVTVPAGSYEALRVVTRGAAYVGQSLVVPIRESDTPFETYERTCWWATTLSIEVRCDRVSARLSEVDGSVLSNARGRKELTAYTAP